MLEAVRLARKLKHSAESQNAFLSLYCMPKMICALSVFRAESVVMA
jgi:hypothetical protein